MPFLIDTAQQLGQNELSKVIARDYIGYLSGMKDEELYTKANIAFLASYIKDSKSKYMFLFYPNGHKVDSVMSQKGFAQHVVDRVIVDSGPW